MTWSRLPALNAVLNGLSACLLAAGYVFIRRRDVVRHHACMMTAFAFSTLFLFSYLAYHVHAGPVYYRQQGWMRQAYLTILTTHTLLAIAVVPLGLRTLFLAFSARFEAHRRLARWTLPIWFYVSVTGVVIYEMLY